MIGVFLILNIKKGRENMRPLIGLVPLVDRARESLWMLPGYMDRVSLRENIRLFLRLNKRLLSRIRKGGRDAGCHI